ncbi:PTS sugar transporter subunit IIB [Clostridium tagluense]|uniref:PTS sugar transporter subunit IIB n=1 Tax=Clostridium tagluense TaxID=360422 RepID=UPI001CF55654|nr:PTS sugar transporter subunit IIB [Clostridium tagluense]MCB2298823.1 PTS sugar transporter subunit IIB [Clostridium tagluense]
MNILLCCAGGMSTSLLVKKMQEAAVQMGIESKIWAIGEAQVVDNIQNADVLLLGPQIRFKLNDLKKMGKEHHIPVEVISMIDYGRINGKAVLEYAMKLIELQKES